MKESIENTSKANSVLQDMEVQAQNNLLEQRNKVNSFKVTIGFSPIFLVFPGPIRCYIGEIYRFSGLRDLSVQTDT